MLDRMFDKFKQFVDEILADNSRLAKIAVLEKYKDDKDIKYLLDFIYNPYITTGISSKKLQRQAHWYPPEYVALKDVLEYAKEHNTGSDMDLSIIFTNRDNILSFKCSNIEEIHTYADLFNKVITKNLQLGVDVKTINKVIPGLIPEFNVMLANKYFDKPEVVEGKEFVITTKIDGSRIIAMKDNGAVSFWTRQGQKYEGLVDLEKDLLDCQFDNFVFDGEIVAIDTAKEDTYKNTMKLSRTKDTEKHGLQMLVFDYMPVANFKAQCCPTAYTVRRAQLSSIMDLSNFEYFKLLPMLYKGTDTNKILEFLDEQVSKGEEGIMLNIASAGYDFKRSQNLLKVKKFQDIEVKIIGFEEGINKLENSLGAFICEYKNSTVKVGSGLSENDRINFWNNRDSLIGKYITVKYFEESKDSKTGLPSLRFPIFLRIREDM